MAQAVAEVPEAQAEGKVKSTYDDIKATLRVPYVGPLFRELAIHPDYLQTAWTALKPNLQIVYFEHQADTVRRAAVEAASALGTPPAPAEDVRGALTVLHYATPKLFLTAAILRAATAGSLPQMLVLPAEEKRRISPGVPAGMEPFHVDDASSADDSIQSIVDQARAEASGIGSALEFGALVRAPQYVESAWAALKPLAGRAEFMRSVRSLRLQAERTVTVLPFRIDITPHTLRHSGLSERAIDDIRDILSRAYAQGAAALVGTAFLAIGLDGRERAAASPFPLSGE